MAILTKAGRTAMAAFVHSRPIYMCWGNGESSWGENPPDPSVADTHLKQPVGYRKMTEVAFCKPHAEGDIDVPTGRYQKAAAGEQTNHLYVRFRFDFEDAQSETIQETGLFIDTKLKSGVPAGKGYFSPSDIKSPGILFLLENRAPLHRDLGVRESFEFVVTF